MNKVITINLGGTAYQLEEGGYYLLPVIVCSPAKGVFSGLSSHQLSWIYLFLFAVRSKFSSHFPAVREIAGISANCGWRFGWFLVAKFQFVPGCLTAGAEMTENAKKPIKRP